MDRTRRWAGGTEGTDDRALRDKRYAVIGFPSLTAPHPQKTLYDPAGDAVFPDGMTISGNRDPRWSEGSPDVAFGIHYPRRRAGGSDDAETDRERDAASREAQPASSGPTADERVDFVLWHWQDSRLQSQQQVQESRDRNFSYLAQYRLQTNALTRLADEEMRTVTPTRGDRWAIGMDDREYELFGNLNGQRFQDVYAVDLHTGQRRLAAKRVRWFHGASPDGASFLYYEDGHYYVHALASGETRNITQGVPTSFINAESDTNIVNPPTGVMGWAADSRSVLLHDGTSGKCLWAGEHRP